MNRSLITSVSLLLLFVLTTAMSCDRETPIVNLNWIIGSKKTECEGVTVQQCFWIKTSGVSSEWERYYDQIEGFDYLVGYEYEITVSEEAIANPPADGSSLKHTLVEVLSKEMKESEGIPD